MSNIKSLLDFQKAFLLREEMTKEFMKRKIM